MRSITAKRFVVGTAVLWAIGSIAGVRAQLGVGNWAQSINGTPTGMTMTVEVCCGSGYRLTYHLPPSAGGTVMIVESALDGKDAAVMIAGKPSGETMAIKRIDATHISGVVKMNGQPTGTSKAALSADGKTLTVETEMTASAGQPAGKTIEVWTKK